MTVKTDLAADTALTPKAAGLISRAISVFIKSDPKAAMELAQDASVAALGKANSLLTEGDDTEHPGHVEDQWDGPPDDRIETQGAGGPESTVAPGKVGVGPAQSASGDGAEVMQRTYSRPAKQSGVQTATEALGRSLMRHGRAMKAILTGMDAQSQQITALKAMLPDPAAAEAAIVKAVGEAIAKAMPGVVAKAVTEAVAKAMPAVLAKAKTAAKGESDEESGKDDEEEDEEEDDEAKESESGSGTEIEIVNENEDEDEDEDEAAKAQRKSAAVLRVQAKSRVRWAMRRLAKAEEMGEDGKPKTAERMKRMARHNLRKAQERLVQAEALRAGPSAKALGKAIAKSIAKARKGLEPSKTENQDEWPATTEKKVGTGKAAPTQAQLDLQRAAEQIGKAASGLGMLTTDVQTMLKAIGGQSRNPDSLPPAFLLAKANPQAIDAKLTAVQDLVAKGEITAAEFEDTKDAITRLRMASAAGGMPAQWAQRAYDNLPQRVRQVMGDGLAA